MKDNNRGIVNDAVCLSVIDLQEKANTKEEEATKYLQNDDKNKIKKTKKGKDKSKDEFKINKIGLLISEFIGTALLLFLGCMGCITEYEGIPIPHYMPAVSFGLTVMLVIQIFGHISGAHLNPAVTLATVMLGYLDKSLAPVYLVGQFAGAILGLGALKMLVPLEYAAQEMFNVETNTTTRRLGLCTTLPHSKMSVMQAVTIEGIITAVLILVCCAIWDRRNAVKQDSTPLRFGFIIACIGMAAGPFTGGSMNTARSFAPALLNGDWTHQWIYWIGPNVGAVLAVLLYKGLYTIPPVEDNTDDDILDEVPLKNINGSEKV